MLYLPLKYETDKVIIYPLTENPQNTLNCIVDIKIPDWEDVIHKYLKSFNIPYKQRMYVLIQILTHLQYEPQKKSVIYIDPTTFIS